MRKVYSNESNSLGLIVSMICSIGLTVVLFGALPFAHRIGRPERPLEMVKTQVTDDQEDEQKKMDETPPPEAEKPPEAPPPPDLAEPSQVVPPSADIDVALGTGGGLENYGASMVAEAVQSIKEDVFTASELERKPVPVSQAPPQYPDELRKSKVEGLVTMVFVLNEEGRVEEPRVEESSRPEFEKPALEAVRKWRFQPGMKDGQPVRTYVRVPIRFRVSSG